LSGVREKTLVKIGGVCGATAQACREAATLKEIGYDAGLVSLSGLNDASDADLIEHCLEVATILPLIGFYLQPAVGGRPLSFEFWREFAQIDNVVAIKVAPFNRYQTLDVMRGVAESGPALATSRFTPVRRSHRRRSADRFQVPRHDAAFCRRSSWPMGGMDEARGGIARSRAMRPKERHTRRTARAVGRDHRCERRDLRREEWFSRLYRGYPRDLAAAGSDARPLVPGSVRRPVEWAAPRNRPRLFVLSSFDRRRVCERNLDRWLA